MFFGYGDTGSAESLMHFFDPAQCRPECAVIK